MKIHPAADLFPIDEADLAALVEDIAEHGQRETIKVVANTDGELVVVDGRTRLAACAKLGIEPRIERLADDTDLDAYVVSVNLTRRNLTAGQRAMLYAKIYPKQQGKKRGTSLETEEVSAARVSQARAVLEALPEVAQQIIRGEAKLDAAYQQVLEMRRESSTTEARMSRLPADLRAKVVEQEMDLKAAEAEAKDRYERDLKAAEAVMFTFRDLLLAANAYALDDSAQKLLDAKTRFPERFADICRPPFNGFDEAVLKSLPKAAKHLAAIVKGLTQ